jgi:hypothetical protein
MWRLRCRLNTPNTTASPEWWCASWTRGATLSVLFRASCRATQPTRNQERGDRLEIGKSDENDSQQALGQAVVTRVVKQTKLIRNNRRKHQVTPGAPLPVTTTHNFGREDRTGVLCPSLVALPGLTEATAAGWLATSTGPTATGDHVSSLWSVTFAICVRTATRGRGLSEEE